MAEIHKLPTGPTEADVMRALAGLVRSQMVMGAKLMNALECGKDHFPAEARPLVDDLADSFSRMKESTERVLKQVAA